MSDNARKWLVSVLVEVAEGEASYENVVNLIEQPEIYRMEGDKIEVQDAEPIE